jgi:hypothetical protein
MANETLREGMNRANANSLDGIYQAVNIGDILTQKFRRVVRAKVPTVADRTSAAGLSEDAIKLHDYLKASRITRGWARSTGAAGALGELTVSAVTADPGAAEIAVAPNGDIVLQANDAYTSVDIDYYPAKGRVVSVDLTVVAGTGVCTLPSWLTALHPHMLLNATATAGGAVAAKVVDFRGAVAPAAGFACLNLVGTIVYFAVADAVTACTLKLMVDEGVDSQGLLTSDNTSHV